jgi:hypothetical protein
VRHIKDPRFKPLYDALPSRVRELADKNFALLKQDPKHPSLHFKRLMADVWSVRIGRGHRALAIEGKDRFQWYWIGSHADYDRLIG